MAFDPVEIYIGNQSGEGWTKSTGWTSMSLARSKDQMTGSLRVEYFFGYVPEEPVHVDAAYGREILVYVDGWLAFTGIIDGRNGQGANTDMGGDQGRAVSIGPNEYTVTINARGKTKQLIDSSHDIRTNMNGTSTREVVERLVAPWGIDLDWDAISQPLNKSRFRDGARVVDELNRIGLENAHYMFEGRDGSLIVTDGAGRGSGDNIILGRNVLSFSANQAEARAKSSIRVKGQRTEETAWGEDAVLPTVIEVESNDLLANTLRPIVVQHYGDATPEALERRAVYEANKRAQGSKYVTVDVFSVDSASGVPWDLGLLHRVIIPPEGIDTVLECVGVSYNCNAGGEIKTTLTLAPMPRGAKGVAFGPLANLPQEDLDRIAKGARIIYGGNYPAPWTIGQFSIIDIPVIGTVLQALGNITRQVLGDLRNLGSEDGKPPERLH